MAPTHTLGPRVVKKYRVTVPRSASVADLLQIEMGCRVNVPLESHRLPTSVVCRTTGSGRVVWIHIILRILNHLCLIPAPSPLADLVLRRLPKSDFLAITDN
jgi:hypothetical protein